MNDALSGGITTYSFSVEICRFFGTNPAPLEKGNDDYHSLTRPQD